MKRLTKKQREAWKALYAPGDHLEVGIEEWKELHQQMEMEFEKNKLGKLLERVPFPEQEKVA